MEKKCVERFMLNLILLGSLKVDMAHVNFTSPRSRGLHCLHPTLDTEAISPPGLTQYLYHLTPSRSSDLLLQIFRPRTKAMVHSLYFVILPGFFVISSYVCEYIECYLPSFTVVTTVFDNT